MEEYMSEEFENDEIQSEVELSLQDTESLVEESKELLKNLYNLDEPQVRRIVTQDDLRNDVSSFVSSRLRHLENQSKLKGLFEAEMAKKVLAHDMSTDEIFRGYSMISAESARNIDSLFKLFAPTQTSPNTILTPATKDEETKTFELTSSQRQALEKLSRIIENSNSKKDESSVE
jgi:predicted HNH restriction endonuclease